MPVISDKYKKEEQKPSSVEALLRMISDDVRNELTEINYPYEIMALRQTAKVVKNVGGDFEGVAEILDSAVDMFKEEMIPFKRKRVEEFLKALKNSYGIELSEDEKEKKKKSLLGN